MKYTVSIIGLVLMLQYNIGLMNAMPEHMLAAALMVQGHPEDDGYSKHSLFLLKCVW